MKQLFAFLFCLCIAAPTAFAQKKLATEKNLRKHITFLASDKLKGRSTGTRFEEQAAAYIAKQFKKIGLQPKGDQGTWLYKFGFKRSSDPHGMNHDGPQEYGYNVAGYLDNGATNTIVIGAHYDHLGLGHDHNSLDANPFGKIHNGADDNASGTAAVIEMARYFASNGVKEQHNFLFLCFSGEELGLLGSKKYTENPTIDLSKVSLMLNMDMVGRLTDDKGLLIGGVGTSPAFVPLLKSLQAPFKIKQDSAGMGPSDHSSFYLKNIPVLFAFTGQHYDYHKPSDDTDKINFAGEQQVIAFLIRVLEQLDSTPKLVFQETKSNKDSGSSSGGFKVTLGIMPDYTFEGAGVKVDGVTDGRPAAKAGVLKGDVIVQLGDYEIKDMGAYMKSLNKFEKGQSSQVKVQRGEELKVFPITF